MSDGAGTGPDVPTAEPVAEEAAEPQVPAHDTPIVAPEDEPAGWAVAPEPEPEASAVDAAAAAAAAAGATASEGIGDATGQAGEVDDAAAQTGEVADAAAQQVEQVAEPAAEAAGQAAAAAESAVPAGWYADPSGRYELRYWDGSAWTEHVSRAGQQYTDPPVA